MSDLPKIEQYRLVWKNADKQIHRDGDLPAIIRRDGVIEYRKNGKTHRDGDKPAHIDPTFGAGSVTYYKNDKKHRDGGLPAVIQKNGEVEYWHDGERYYPGGLKLYWHHGKPVEPPDDL
jgi:hypothetical protein